MLQRLKKQKEQGMVHSLKKAKRAKRAKDHDQGEAFQPGPSLPGHTLQYARHDWIIDQNLILCSRREFHCLKLLFEHRDQAVTFEQLFAQLRSVGLLPEHAVPKLLKVRLAQIVSRLRAKLWPYGMDIASLTNIGYMLLSQIQKEEHQFTESEEGLSSKVERGRE